MTFNEQRLSLLDALRAARWDVHTRSMQGRDLKVPYAISPSGVRLEFRTQAIYDGGTGHSIASDMRRVSAEQLLRYGERRWETR